jgi:NADH-quinone oxidoreductase subunit A
VWVYLVVLLLFAFGTLGIAAFFRARGRPAPKKYETYECGEEPVGEAWIRFHVGYYLVALVFILFDIETMFLFPWAVSFKKLGGFVFWEMIVFLLILFLGWIYALRKGDLEWK